MVGKVPPPQRCGGAKKVQFMFGWRLWSDLIIVRDVDGGDYLRLLTLVTTSRALPLSESPNTTCGQSLPCGVGRYVAHKAAWYISASRRRRVATGFRTDGWIRWRGPRMRYLSATTSRLHGSCNYEEDVSFRGILLCSLSHTIISFDMPNSKFLLVCYTS